MAEQFEKKKIEYEYLVVTENFDKMQFYKNCYKLIFVLKGNLAMRLNGAKVLLEEQGYMIVRPIDKCAFAKRVDDAEIISLSVAETEMHKVLDLLGEQCKNYVVSHNKLVVNGDYNVKLKVEEIHSRILKYGDSDYMLSKLFLFEIVSGMARLMHRDKYADSIPQHIVDAVNGLKNLENLQVGVKYIERTLNYSRSQLCRIFKKYYGKRPSTSFRN